MTVPTISWDETSPANTDNASQGDDRIRETKTQIREVIDVDHDFPSSGQAADVGQHKQVTLQEQADIGSGAEGVPILGAQTIDGKAELVFTDEDDNDIQITKNGIIKDSFQSGDYLFTSRTGAISGWTDKSTTLANMFIRVVETASETGATMPNPSHVHGLNSHTHTTPNHVHNLYSNTNAGGRDTLETVAGGVAANSNHIASSGGGTSGVASGNTTSTGDIVQYIAMRLYKKD